MDIRENKSSPTNQPPPAESVWEASDLTEWVAVDLETTGLNPKVDAIIEIGAVRFVNGKEQNRFVTLVNPQRTLPAFITGLTGIDETMLAEAPPLKETAEAMVEFVGESPLVGKNIWFDLDFLQAAPELTERFRRVRVVQRAHDAGLTARFVYPCLEHFGLGALADTFNLTTKPRHRAADDAAATGELFARLFPELVMVSPEQLHRALRFVDGTSSPLANTLRAAIRCLNRGVRPMGLAPDPMAYSPIRGRSNVFAVDGPRRPASPVEVKQLRDLLEDRVRMRAVIPDWEHRLEQVAMVEAVHETLTDGGFILLEAGTGVGKSLGYLLPALLSGRRVVVSTFTKNLQEQLFYDEIPRLAKLLDFGFSSALIKGRHNYLCRTRWLHWLNNPERMASLAVREQAASAVRWVDATRTGDLTELGTGQGEPGLWFRSLVASEAGFCTTRTCAEGECPLARIRRAALKADLVVANHSLILSGLDLDGTPMGNAVDFIFDEGHHLEDVATEVFGADLTQADILDVLNRLERLCRRRSELQVYIQSDVGLQDLTKPLEAAASDAQGLGDSVDALFNWLRDHFPRPSKGGRTYANAFTYVAGDADQAALAEVAAPLMAGLNGLTTRLVGILQRLSSVEETSVPAPLVQELFAAVETLAEVVRHLTYVTKADDPNGVFWVEVPLEDRPVHLRGAPLSVAEILKERLWNRVRSAVVCSATLATEAGPAGFAHLTSRLGLVDFPNGKVRTVLLGTPFDLERCRLVVFPSYVPPPDQAEAHCREVAAVCAQLALDLRNNILVLFTSYESMRAVAEQLQMHLAGSGVDVMTAEPTGSRERLVERFRRMRGAILMGTDALWEGIDAPGEALEVVVIPRLPFAVPTDPLIAARSRQVQEMGGNAFNDYQVPLAVLRLRQGAGRLIRKSRDRGVVLVLDSRTVTRNYGADFRQALPGRHLIPQSRSELLEKVREFFGNRR